MFCATKTQIKVCTSLTTTGLSSAAASCGGYQILDFAVLNSKTQCSSTEIQLNTVEEFGFATASPFTLTNTAAVLLVVAILLSWSFGWSFKQMRIAMTGGSPE
jgi:hypothetical protein